MSRVLDDKVIVVTGALGLLGYQWCGAAQNAGATTIGIDCKPMTDHAKTGHPKFTGFRQIDLSDGGDHGLSMSFVDDIEESYGPIDGLVNAACYNPNPSKRQREHHWDIQFALFRGIRDTMRYIGDGMAERGSGSIVNIGSDLSLIAPDQSLYRSTGMNDKPDHYTVVKHAMVGLTKHYASLWASHGVRVNVLCPGPVDPDPHENIPFKDELRKRIPAGKLASPDTYDDAVVFLLSDASIFMTGSVMVMDGGRTTW
jgi:NAD(P)-dependent dehydrogenase (short-subunit alcohol dehydrogenase family)